MPMADFGPRTADEEILKLFVRLAVARSFNDDLPDRSVVGGDTVSQAKSRLRAPGRTKLTE
jgi:hypothetical protein